MYEDLPLFIKQTARKVIASKFKFVMLKLWEFARLFAAVACVNLVFPPQKLNSNDALQRDTRRFNAAFLIEFLQFLLCNLRYKCPNWTDWERLPEGVLVVELKFRSPLYYKQIVWD